MNNKLKDLIVVALLTGSSTSLFAQTAFVVKGNLKDTSRVTAKGLAEDKEGVSALYNKLAAPLKATVVGKQLGELIETAFKLGPGEEIL